MRKSVFVESVRLLIVLLGLSGGYTLGHRLDAVLFCTVIGASLAYVAGGVLGRSLRSATERVEERTTHMSAGEFLAGSLGALLVGAIAALVAVPAIGMLPGRWGIAVFCLVVWIGVHAGFRILRSKSASLLALVDLTDDSRLKDATERARDAVLADTSVLVDGRLLRLCRTGFLHRNLLVPGFVLDEVQEMAGASDLAARRKARQGLEALEAIKREKLLNVRVLEERVPEIEAVDAKLVAVATRMGVPLLTNDEPLSQIAELRGVRCLNLNRLVRSLSSVLTPGDRVQLEIVKPGQGDGEGVGYLDEGSMVVVADASHRVGEGVEVEVTSSTRTQRGRIFFASLAEA